MIKAPLVRLSLSKLDGNASLNGRIAEKAQKAKKVTATKKTVPKADESIPRLSKLSAQQAAEQLKEVMMIDETVSRPKGTILSTYA